MFISYYTVYVYILVQHGCVQSNLQIQIPHSQTEDAPTAEPSNALRTYCTLPNRCRWFGIRHIFEACEAFASKLGLVCGFPQGTPVASTINYYFGTFSARVTEMVTMNRKFHVLRCEKCLAGEKIANVRQLLTWMIRDIIIIGVYISNVQIIGWFDAALSSESYFTYLSHAIPSHRCHQ